VRWALANARDFLRNSAPRKEYSYLAATRYIEVTLGRKRTIYTRQGRLVKCLPAAYPTAGIAGNYAEVSWDLLDKSKKQFCDTIGYYVVTFRNGRWQVASQTGTEMNYPRDELKRARVPASFVKRLRLGFASPRAMLAHRLDG
jgi:hypothetical protein